MPQPGEILCYDGYEFEDGSKAVKLFVVLSLVDVDCPCLVLKTTSKPNRYTGANKGCNPKKKVFFVPTGWETCFDVDTYIQLPQIIEIPPGELLEGHFCKRIRVVDSLSPQCLALLKGCLKQFREDIAEVHWRLIFKS